MVEQKIIIERSERILEALHVVIDNLRPPFAKPDRLRVALFLTIAEQFEAALALAHQNMASHSALHVRSMLEAFVAMTLLGRSANHVDQMMYNQLKNEKKMYEEVLQLGNLPPDIEAEVKTRLDECKPRFDALHAAGMRPTQIASEIHDAGLPHLLAPYAMLCGFSHNHIAIIAMRHQGEEGMTYLAPVAPDVVTSIFSVALQILVPATEPLSKLASFPEGLFESMFQEITNLWGSILKDAEIQ